MRFSTVAEGFLDCLTSDEPYLFDVEPGLYLAEHDVVNAALVSEPDNGRAFAGKQCEAQCGVLLIVPSRSLVTRVFTVRVQNVQVFLVLKA
jgi:hypothetical protein